MAITYAQEQEENHLAVRKAIRELQNFTLDELQARIEAIIGRELQFAPFWSLERHIEKSYREMWPLHLEHGRDYTREAYQALKAKAPRPRRPQCVLPGCRY